MLHGQKSSGVNRISGGRSMNTCKPIWEMPKESKKTMYWKHFTQKNGQQSKEKYMAKQEREVQGNVS